jgi:hypothetical protein
VAKLTIQDLGSLGELIAAIATIATLGYLAVQIRQNTLSNRDASARSAHDMILRVNGSPLADPALIDLLNRGAEDHASLNPVESTRYHIHWMNTFFMYQDVFFLARRSQIEPYLWTGVESHMFEYLESPGLSSWWESNQRRFADEFRDHVNENRETRS